MNHKKIKINLGCGEKYMKGYINCDVLKNIKTDKVFDLDKFPYPFRDECADEVLVDNVLEHVEDVVSVMKEVHRILRKGGKMRIYVPYGKSDGAFQDPTHRHLFTEKSMNYFVNNYTYSYYSEFKFKKIKVELFTSDKTFISRIRTIIPFRKILRHFLFNMYDGIYFELEAIK